MKKLVTLLLAMSMILSLIGGVAVAEEKPTLVCWTILNPESDADPRNVAFRKIIENWNATNEWGATMTVNPVNWADLHMRSPRLPLPAPLLTLFALSPPTWTSTSLLAACSP